MAHGGDGYSLVCAGGRKAALPGQRGTLCKKRVALKSYTMQLKTPHKLKRFPFQKASLPRYLTQEEVKRLFWGCSTIFDKSYGKGRKA